jgi:hypothetical protein
VNVQYDDLINKKLNNIHKLERILVGVWVPMRPVPIACIIGLIFNFSRGYPERYGFVRLGCNLSEYVFSSARKHIVSADITYDEVLLVLVGWFPLLLPCTHETPTRSYTFLHVGKMYLNHQPFLAGVGVSNLGHTIPRPSNLQKDLALHRGRGSWGHHEL